jgi:hypothetical protein
LDHPVAIGTHAEKFLGIRNAAVCYLPDVVRIQEPPQVRRILSESRHVDRLRVTPRGIACAAERAGILRVALATLARIGISLHGPLPQEGRIDCAFHAVGFVHCLLDQQGICKFYPHVSFAVPVVMGKADY